ncbi:MAG TPA: chaperone NapD [Zoogloea sp.]|uniref:chaperone NapD n=1 Tax=Zoogloea sp. TaxID=49181 RepID=UPI002B582978|nr:chaperone NapD [Zoogloea sp.]HMV18377.1 chaperone NapD [Rhodocyclaceae bacterium]HMV62433.1 chaperone NapD [Rhodocyclaceae bacterium]HMW52676.1 chaperone NapD [Rhodocyclaceae bacterium]HMY50556.1 chaperone NapD [Rhodocyclaceae bacterium]HMZ77112.1 chaperone NapD [Rhodocyclaceae bacterium]
MNIVSLVLRIHPDTRAEAEAALTAFPGVECHGMSDDGKLVVTVEDAEGASMSDTLIALHRVPQVLAATLAYEYTDRTAATPTHAPNSNSPCEEAQS